VDFYNIRERVYKKTVEIYPDFKICRSKDLMIRGKSFYAIWDEEKQLWSTDEYDVQRLIDDELFRYRDKFMETSDEKVVLKLMSDYSSNAWSNFRKYIGNLSDNAHQLDATLTFSNTDCKKKDYVSKKLSYPISEGPCSAFDEIITTLYDVDERRKLEWAIGAIVSGDSKDIQKFIVLYGDAGSGKSTILNIIQKLFAGYYTTFDAKALTSSNNAFATEVFKQNPLVAIQHDGDLSKIEDNTRLNSIVSHEEMSMNEKYKPSYTARTNCFLFIGTNKPVKITDAKSGIIRRLIDVKPSGRKIPSKPYQDLMSQIDFELGYIANKCLHVYKELGKNRYSTYRPMDMILQTDVFYNFVESHYDIFKEADGISLAQAYALYKEYCDDSTLEFKIPKFRFREELRNYFNTYSDRTRVNGVQIRSYYSGFIFEKCDSNTQFIEKESAIREMVLQESLLDKLLAEQPAQYVNDNEEPKRKWVNVKQKLKQLDTSKTHYVKPPQNHIVIDFDLKNDKGDKDLDLNIEAANKWPKTYSEISKGGNGVHLHYIYEGDVTRLLRTHSEGIEVKVFVGDSALRRKLTKCNNEPVNTINSGLSLKGETMIDLNIVKQEKGIRELIKRNLNKDIHPGTKPSIDFIHKILEDAYKSGVKYDVIDMRPAILAFAVKSSHQSDYCIKLVCDMKYKSEDRENTTEYDNDTVIFFDVEVFPNLFVVCLLHAGKAPFKLINPTGMDLEPFFKFKLVGFNCRRYDNHILYARYLGYDNEQLYKLSQRIISGSPNCMFSEAYNLSYTDIYDFSSKKQSLKKFEIELGIKHLELGLPWDQPVPEELWNKVAEYCMNDVIATEQVFNDRKQDFMARMILSELSGLSPNDTTQMHAAKIIFGDDPTPQKKFRYTKLEEMFKGYKYEFGKSTYRGEDPGEGGYVYAEPGMYLNTAVLDVTSMHPTSLIELEAFGRYTYKVKELLDARVAIKHKFYDVASKMLNGVLVKYLENVEDSEKLSYALKIVINIIYGLTSAKFDNKFKDPKNVDNIVAKRGALFMIDLKHEVKARGFTVAHIKTDSIKIPNATTDIINFVMEFGKKYGYNFEHEATYERFCLVNDSVFIAKERGKEWKPTGAQFAQPYVYKTLFSKEKITLTDMCETKAVTTAMYLDFRSHPDEESMLKFIGKVGCFIPVVSPKIGGTLLREKDGKYYAVTGTKGYLWAEKEIVMGIDNITVNLDYHEKQAIKAREAISKHGDFDWFVSEPFPPEEGTPFEPPCGTKKYDHCHECPNYRESNPEVCRLGYDVLPF